MKIKTQNGFYFSSDILHCFFVRALKVIKIVSINFIA